MRTIKRKRSLETISIPNPCEVPWDEMKVLSEGRRHCELCNEDVFNLSSMTRETAEKLVFESTGRLCVGFYRRRDGTVVTSDCTPTRNRVLRRAARRSLKIGARVASAGLAVLGAIGVARAAAADDWLRRVVVAKTLQLQEVQVDGVIPAPTTEELIHDSALQFLGGAMIGEVEVSDVFTMTPPENEE